MFTEVLYTMRITNNSIKCMHYYYTLFCLSISIVLTNRGMQDQTALTSLPNFVLHNLLKYCSTQQLLRFREINKQAQQVAELFLSTDYSKKITINYNFCPSIEVIKKLAGIKLQLGGQYMYIAGFLIDKLSHIKALDLYVPNIIDNTEKSNIKILLTQLQSLEALRIQYGKRVMTKSWNNSYAVNIVQALPRYANLKKLHVNFIARGLLHWDAWLQRLPDLKKLQVLHIEGKQAFNTEQFITFTKVLQNLTLLKQLCLHDIIIDEEKAEALGRSLSTLKNLRILNLRKSIMKQKDVQKLKELLPAIQNGKFHAPLSLSQHPYFIREG